MEDHPPASQMSIVGNIVHDLKTPISAIKSYADLIEQSGELSEKQAHFLQRILLATENMTNLIRDVLDLVWIDEGLTLTKAPCNLRDIAAAEIGLLTSYAQIQSITITLETAQDLPLAEADEKRIRQVFKNLLSNSIKYNRPDGHIFVKIIDEAQSLRVLVQDEGIGIAPEEMAHIFERFYRARRAKISQIEGSGLGLSIAKAIVEAHGGCIGAKSTPGQGSTFWFTLPV